MEITITKERKQFFFDVLLMYCAFFDVSFVGVPTVISLRKIAFAYFVVIILLKRRFVIEKKTIELLKIPLIISSFALLYIMLISLIYKTYQSEYFILPRLIYFILYSILGPCILASRYQEEKHFMKSVVCAMTLQAFAVFLLYLNGSLSIMVSKVVRTVGNVSFSRNDRATGLGAEAGYLTILLFIGVLCANYLFYEDGKKKKYIIAQMIFIGAMFITGRTGLYLSIAFYGYTIFISIIREGNAKEGLKKLIGALVAASAILLYMKQRLTTEQFNRFYNRLFGVFGGLGNDESIKHLTANSVPKLTLETLMGTGIYRGYSPNGVLFWHDSGYVQNYSALGLVICVVFYLAIYLTFFRALDDRGVRNESRFRHFFLFLAVALIVVEVKEPFIFKYVPTMFFLTAVSLKQRKCSIEEYYQRYYSGL